MRLEVRVQKGIKDLAGDDGGNGLEEERERCVLDFWTEVNALKNVDEIEMSSRRATRATVMNGIKLPSA